MKPQDMISVIQAYIEGADIQSRKINDIEYGVTTYFDCESPQWDFANCEYRVKPAPREFWIDLNSNGNVNHCTHYTADRNEGMRYIKVREVLE